MEQWEFIETVAAELEVSPEAIRKWRVRGVPHQWRLAIIDAAARKRFALDRAEFGKPPGPKREAPPPTPIAPERATPEESGLAP